MSYRAGLAFLLTATWSFSAGAQAIPAPEPIEIIPGRKQLFLDDFAVQEMSNLRRTMHQPVKRGAVIRPDLPSDGTLVQIRCAPVWAPDEQVYKIIYTAYTMDDHSQIGPALAISKDGLRWEKPLLAKTRIRGTRQNNRIVVDPKIRWPHNYFENIVYDPDDPDSSRRYKGLVGAEGRIPVVSPDCVNWRRLDVATLPSGDESTLTYDREKRRFLAMLKTWNQYGRASSISVSADFVHWSKPRFLFGADAEDQRLAPVFIRKVIADPGLAKPLFVDPDPATGWKPPKGNQPTWRAECYNMGVFPYEGIYIGMLMMYYPTGTCLPARNNTDGFHLIQLAMTRDLVHWIRLGDRQPFIGPSRIDKGLVGVYDRIELCVTNRPVEHGDELWFYYSGLKWRDAIYELNRDGTPRDPKTLSEQELADLKDGWGAACLAVLRRDGFISLDADEQGGYVLTRPLRLSGRNLFINAEAPAGEVSVELLDEKGRSISEFSRKRDVPVRGDAVRLPVKWRSGGDLTRLHGRTVRLKFHLERAKLYAFWTE
jgi:hypothetical protein